MQCYVYKCLHHARHCCACSFFSPGLLFPAQLATITHSLTSSHAARPQHEGTAHAAGTQNMLFSTLEGRPVLCFLLFASSCRFWGRGRREKETKEVLSRMDYLLSYVPLSPNNCTHSTISRRCTHRQQTARWLTWRGWLTGKRCCLH